MTTPIIQDGFDVRPMTEAEHAEYLALCEELAAEEKRKADLQAQKASARAKLAAVGLTEDEINALLGV
jgi:uncharacterized protein YlxW (UPF0749 family)